MKHLCLLLLLAALAAPALCQGPNCDGDCERDGVPNRNGTGLQGDGQGPLAPQDGTGRGAPTWAADCDGDCDGTPKHDGTGRQRRHGGKTQGEGNGLMNGDGPLAPKNGTGRGAPEGAGDCDGDCDGTGVRGANRQVLGIHTPTPVKDGSGPQRLRTDPARPQDGTGARSPTPKRQLGQGIHTPTPVKDGSGPQRLRTDPARPQDGTRARTRTPKRQLGQGIHTPTPLKDGSGPQRLRTDPVRPQDGTGARSPIPKRQLGQGIHTPAPLKDGSGPQRLRTDPLAPKNGTGRGAPKGAGNCDGDCDGTRPRGANRQVLGIHTPTPVKDGSGPQRLRTDPVRPQDGTGASSPTPKRQLGQRIHTPAPLKDGSGPQRLRTDPVRPQDGTGARAGQGRKAGGRWN